MPWVRGQSGNPGGRPRAVVEVAELARLETTASIRALVRVRDSKASPPAAVVAAATALLDRAWGRPVQSITAPGGSSLGALHFLAATEISKQMLADRGQRPTIAGIAEPAEPPPADLLAAPLPLE
jgi:hypothetical protein